MSGALVKTDNELAWNGRQRPFHELYSLKLNGSNGKFCLIVRYGLITPFGGKLPGVAVLSAVYAEPHSHPLTLSRLFDLDAHDVMHAGEFLRIGTARLSLADCVGEITEGNDLVKWDLSFEDPVESLRVFPSLSFLLPVLRGTSCNMPRLSGFVSGTVYAGARTWHVRHEKIFQDHVHAGEGGGRMWTRASCLNFREDRSAWFSAFSLPWTRWGRNINFFCAGLEGGKYLANSLTKILWTNRTSRQDGIWEADFTSGGLRFECRILFDPAGTVANSGGFSGETTMMADAEIRVSRRQRGVWREYRKLTAVGACFMELINL